MTGSDRTPSTAVLDPAIVAELRRVLSHSIQRGTHSDDLKGMLQRAAVDAREKGLRAEQLLLLLKDIWYSLPPLSTGASRETQTRLLQQLVARCIEEYYAT